MQHKNGNKNKLKALAAILNSTLADFWIWYNCPEVGDDRRHMGKAYFENYPIPTISENEENCLVEYADKMLSLNSDLQQKRSRFLRRLQDNFEGVKITGALEQFDAMEFAEFLKELKKQKITLSLSQQDEWEEYFNQYKTDCNNLSAEIAATDDAIDFKVYKLYGLTYDEVLVVDKDTKITRWEYEK